MDNKTVSTMGLDTIMSTQQDPILKDVLADVSKEELFSLLCARDIINPESLLCDAVTAMRRQELLKMHGEAIWLGKDGRYRTHITDKTTGKRRMIARNTLHGVEDALCEYYQDLITNPTIEDAFREWISSKIEFNEISEPSKVKYENDFKRFFLKGGFGSRHLKTLTEEDLTRFVKSAIVSERLTEKTFSGLKILLRGILKHAKTKGYTSISVTNFFGDLEIGRNAFTRKVVDPESEVLREDEIPLVKNYLLERGTVWDFGVLLGLQTGVRVGELASLQWGDWSDKVLSIRRTEARTKDESGRNGLFIKEIPKTDAGARDIFLTDSAVDTLKKIRALDPDAEESDWIFKGRKGQRIRGNTFNKRLGDCLRSLGLKHRTTHKLRKTYGTELHDGGADDSVVQRQLGHSSIETTLRYYIFGNKTRQKQLRQVEDAITF